MASTIVLFEDFDPEKVIYRDPKRSTTGGLSVYLNYDKEGREIPIRIQTPRMRIPFGISCFEGKAQAQKYSLDLSFDDYQSKEEDVGKFYDRWTAFDDRNKNTSFEKSTTWFNKKISFDVVNELYTSAIKPSKKEQYPPTLKCSIPFRNGKPDCQFFDENKELASMEDVEKGMEVQVILEVPRLWFMDKQFGCSPVVKMVQFFPNNRIPHSYSFIEREGVDNCADGAP
eukprot:jgi/Mesvir1/21642/Mv26169-RA.1